MKKTVAMLLVLCLCLCPLCAWAETNKSSGEPDYTELIQAIWAANQLEALFSRHESLQILSSNPAAPDGYDLIWETPDAYYQSFADYFAILERDQTFYVLQDWRENGIILMAGYDYDSYYHLYTLAGKTADDLIDPEHERPIDSYEKDGKLYLTIEFDESLAQQSLESMGLEYSGQAVISRVTMDAASYEILAWNKYTVENGEETVFSTIQVSYDRPEPIACLTLRAAFERTGVATMTITQVFDPDTDHEVVNVMTVPVNTNCSNICSVPYVYFYDKELTRCTGWDRMSDLTVYIYTNPDEALNQHFLELYNEETPQA